MTKKLNTPQNLQDQLRELTDEAEQKKVKLTPEVQAYIQEHLERVQEKLVKGEDVLERDMEFMEDVRLWVNLPEEHREEWPTIEQMNGEMIHERKEAKKRGISLAQWFNLLHIAKAKEEERGWIDVQFTFPGNGKIKSERMLNCTRTLFTTLPEGLSVKGDLFLDGNTTLTHLPEGLSVRRGLWLTACTSLKSLPNELRVKDGLFLSEEAHENVKKQAEKLKKKGKLKGKYNMNKKPTKPQSLLEQLRELTDEAEQKKVKLTVEVQAYIQEHLERVQEKLVKGEDVLGEDMDFIEDVKMWVSLPAKWREKYPTIAQMNESEEMKEARKRDISMQQWLDLLHVVKAKNEEIKWIDKRFIFPGSRRIEVVKDLFLRDCTSLTALPEGLSVGRTLYLSGCTSLISLPEGLSVGRTLWLSDDLNDQVKKDADRLKTKGKIKGEITFI